MSAVIAVLGTGAFAAASCRSLAAAPEPAPDPLSVWLFGKPERARHLAAECNELAARHRQQVVFHPAALRGEDPAAVAADIALSQPTALLVCRSAFSPAELDERDSWATLVKAAGFGVTVALQAAPLYELLLRLGQRGIRCAVFNACYPDAVNPLLVAAGLPVVAGLGNVSALHRAVQRGTSAEVRVLGNHLHLHPPRVDEPECRIWLGSRECQDPAAALAGFRAMPRWRRNELAAGETAAILTAYLGGRPLRTSLSGPLGLPGGYPVTVRRSRVELRLPAGFPGAAATCWNRQALRHEGLEFDADDTVRFSPTAARQLPYPLARCVIGATTLISLASQTSALRRRLRAGPTPTGTRRACAE